MYHSNFYTLSDYSKTNKEHLTYAAKQNNFPDFDGTHFWFTFLQARKFNRENSLYSDNVKKGSKGIKLVFETKDNKSVSTILFHISQLERRIK